jgi:hypothetical protein
MASGLTQHEKALAWARSKVGERERPVGSNRGPFVQACQASTWLGGTGWPWCVSFWVKAWTMAGRKLPYRGAGAYEFLRWHQQHLPAWVVSIEKARPGAAVIWNIGAGHQSMLDRPYSQTKPQVVTIDGNVSDSVAHRTRHHSLVRGVVDPPEDIGIVKPAKPPLFEVVTSESGHKKIYVSTAGAVAKKLPRILKQHPLGVTIGRRKPKP